jgi:hypothetical protein
MSSRRSISELRLVSRRRRAISELCLCLRTQRHRPRDEVGQRLFGLRPPSTPSRTQKKIAIHSLVRSFAARLV